MSTASYHHHAPPRHHQWWAAARIYDDANDDHVLSKDEYEQFYARLLRLLADNDDDDDDLTEDEAKAAMEADWQCDSGGDGQRAPVTNRVHLRPTLPWQPCIGASTCGARASQELCWQRPPARRARALFGGFGWILMAGSVNCQEFKRSVFQLADNWVETVVDTPPRDSSPLFAFFCRAHSPLFASVPLPLGRIGPHRLFAGFEALCSLCSTHALSRCRHCFPVQHPCSRCRHCFPLCWSLSLSLSC